jgi:hypothetical protein
VSDDLPALIPITLAIKAVQKVFVTCTGQELPADKARELIEKSKQLKD